MPKRNNPEDVFRFIDTKDGDTNQCWPWTGALGGRKGDRPGFSVEGVKWLSYRLVYTITRGPIPEGKVVRHKCDNYICCNPFHLELGDQSDNEKDKYLRDRAGLPVTIVREIRRMLQTTKLSQKAIAEDVSQRFNRPISREAVRNINIGARRADGNERTAEELYEERTKHVLQKRDAAE